MSLSARYSIEMMDQKYLPKGLRHTLTDILEYANTYFRPYNRWVAGEALKIARAHGLTKIVELGSGMAPISQRLARYEDIQGIELVVCDLNPNRDLYKKLESTSNGKIQALYESVDYSQPGNWGPKTLLLLNATFHHVPFHLRTQVLQTLRRSSGGVLVCEPLKRDWLSIFFAISAIVPAFLAPLFLHHPGTARRLIWCWLLPIAPFLFVFDGIVSCLRMWTLSEWKAAMHSLEIEEGLFRTAFFIPRQNDLEFSLNASNDILAGGGKSSR